MGGTMECLERPEDRTILDEIKWFLSIFLVSRSLANLFLFFRWRLLILINKALTIHSTKEHSAYSLQFFVRHCLHKVSYEKLAQTLYESFSPSKVLDFGCGNAFVIEYLNKKGVDVRGIDVSPCAYLVTNHSIRQSFFYR